MKCPHCKEKLEVPSRVLRKLQRYTNQWCFFSKCCQELVTVELKEPIPKKIPIKTRATRHRGYQILKRRNGVFWLFKNGEYAFERAGTWWSMISYIDEMLSP